MAGLIWAWEVGGHTTDYHSGVMVIPRHVRHGARIIRSHAIKYVLGEPGELLHGWCHYVLD
jgi:hypothetical protein